MRKTFVTVIMMLLLISLVGCGKKAEPLQEIQEEPIDVQEPEEETQEVENEPTSEGVEIPDEIIAKHCSQNVEDDDVDYEFSDIKSNVSRIENIHSEKGREFSIYWLYDTLYKINLEYFGNPDDTIVFSLDEEYATTGFTEKPDEKGIFQSAKIRTSDGKTIHIGVDHNEGSYDWGEEDNEVVISNDTIVYRYDESSYSYIPMLLGIHDVALRISEDVDFDVFKLNSIETLDTFTGYDKYSNKETGVNEFNFTFPVSYTSSFANLMEIKYKNASNHTLIHSTFYDEDGPFFTTCMNDELEHNPLEYCTSLTFEVMDERDFTEDYQEVGESNNYKIYVRKNELDNERPGLYLFVPKDKLDYRLTNTALNVPMAGVPHINVQPGEEISDEEMRIIVDQFSFNIAKEVQYADNYISSWD